MATATAVRALRDYQQTAVDAVRNEWAQGIVRTVIVHATGLGKTDIIAKLATDEAAAGGRVLLLAQRSEPLDQMTARCLAYAPEVTIGRVQAQRNELGMAITVASIQTLSRPARLAQLTKPTLVIIDECHHALAESYTKILTWAGCFTGTRLLGVTATLVRGDGHGFGTLFESVADQLDIEWGVQHGPGDGTTWLVRPHGHAIVAAGMEHAQLAVRHGDYIDGELGPIVARDVAHIVEAWKRLASDRITAAFTPTVASAQTLTAAFLARGVACELVIGATAPQERRSVYARLAAGVTRVLVGVGVMTEGWDCPPVSCVLIARPTRLIGLYTQMAGRGLRRNIGKSDCLVLDVTDSSGVQQLMSLVDMTPWSPYDRSELTPPVCHPALVPLARQHSSIWGRLAHRLFTR